MTRKHELELLNAWRDRGGNSRPLVRHERPLGLLRPAADGVRGRCTHCLECIWLREIEKRPNANALLTKALAMETEGST